MPKIVTPWAERPLDADFLIDSGLLFEVNHTVFHLLGISLAVKTDERGVKSLYLKDRRKEPEQAIFDKNLMEIGTTKLKKFVDEFAGSQMERRRTKLGWAYQPKT